MSNICIAFTNYGKLLKVEHKENELELFFSTAELGFSNKEDSNFPFIFITDNNYLFDSVIPEDLSSVVSVICYDCPPNESSDFYFSQITTLFNKLKPREKEVVVIHHTHQWQKLLEEISKYTNIFSVRPSGKHIPGNPEYKAVIDIIRQIKNGTAGNTDIVTKYTKQFFVDTKLEDALSNFFKDKFYVQHSTDGDKKNWLDMKCSEQRELCKTLNINPANS